MRRANSCALPRPLRNDHNVRHVSCIRTCSRPRSSTVGRAAWRRPRRACRQALDAEPGKAEAWHLLGMICLDLDRLEEGEQSFRRALELEPDDPATHHALARALAEQHKLREAEAACRRALELDPELAQAYITLGKIFQKSGRWVEAESALAHGLAPPPSRSRGAQGARDRARGSRKARRSAEQPRRSGAAAAGRCLDTQTARVCPDAAGQVRRRRVAGAGGAAPRNRVGRRRIHS